MTVKQNNILVMLYRLLVFLKANLSYFSGFAAMNELITKLEDLIIKIENLGEKQSTDITGLQKRKKSLRSVAGKKALEVSKGLLIYAEESNDEVLAEAVKFTLTDMSKLSDAKLSTTLTIINTAAQNVKTKLENNGISSNKVDDMKFAIDAYKTSINTPKDANIAHKQITGKMALLFVEVFKIVRKIDLMMATFKFTNSELYSEYQSVRKVFSRSGSLVAKVKVSDSTTGMGVRGVRVLFTIDKEVKVDKLTAAGGSLSIKSLTAGKYNVNLSKIGYITQNLMVNVLQKEFTPLNVYLEKEIN